MNTAINHGYSRQHKAGRTLASKYRYQPLSGPLTAVGPSRRGYLRLTVILALGAAVPSALAPVLGFAAVYNYQRPSLALAAAVIVGCWLLIRVLPRPSTVLFSAFLTSGMLANTLFSRWAPVADYFLVPGSIDHYFNLADLLIISAIPVGAIMLIKISSIFFQK